MRGRRLYKMVETTSTYSQKLPLYFGVLRELYHLHIVAVAKDLPIIYSFCSFQGCSRRLFAVFCKAREAYGFPKLCRGSFYVADCNERTILVGQD